MREPGRALSRDIAKGEAVEHELVSFISKRHEQRRRKEADTSVEELWKARERLDAARQRRERDAEWRGWHRSRAALYRRRAAEHDAAAERRVGEGTA